MSKRLPVIFGNSLLSRIVACQNVEFEMQNE
jgi:hypothetical protein